MAAVRTDKRGTMLDLALKLGRRPVKIQVGDYDTRDLIDAEAALWVLGGNKTGVMSQRAKWAFATASAADAFIAKNGGSRSDFSAVLKAAFEDLYDDVAMLRRKRANP